MSTCHWLRAVTESERSIDDVLMLLEEVRRNGFDIRIENPGNILLVLIYHGLMNRSNANTLSQLFFSYDDAAEFLERTIELGEVLDKIRHEPSPDRIRAFVARMKDDQILIHTVTDFLLSNPPPGLVGFLRAHGLDQFALRHGSSRSESEPVGTIIRPGQWRKSERQDLPESRREYEYQNWIRIGQDMEKRGDLDKAEVAYRKAIKINQKDSIARLLLDELLAKQKST
jgi:tetratricopeptide (TPR) repeat protein